MINVNEELLPSWFCERHRQGSLSQQDVVKQMESLAKGNQERRASLWVVYDSDLWDGKQEKTPTAQKRKFTEYLRNNACTLKPAVIGKLIRASEVEMHIGEKIGTHREAVLRPMTPLLTGDKKQYLRDVWSEVMQKAKSSPVKAKHVEAVLKRETYAPLVKSNRGKKTPIGVQNTALIKELVVIAKMLAEPDMQRLLKRAKRLQGKKQPQP